MSVLFAAVLWGTTGTAQAFAPVGATPLTVGALRLFVGGAALWLIVRMGERWRRHDPTRGEVATFRWHPGILAAAVGVAGYQLAFFAGVARTGVAAGTLVTIGSAPVWAGLLEMLFQRRKPGLHWLGATAAAIAGSVLLIGGAQATVDGRGVALNLVAGAAFAVYTVGNKAALHGHPGQSGPVVAASLSIGGLLMTPILIAADVTWLRDPRGLAVVLHLGVVATAFAYALFGRGLAAVSAASATTLTLAEPLTAAVLGVVVLKETLPPSAYGGALLVFGGLFLLAAAEGTGRRPSRDPVNWKG